MEEYRQNAIEHLKTHLGCVGYRDYLIAELEKLDKIEQICKQSFTNSQDSILAMARIREVIEKE